MLKHTFGVAVALTLIASTPAKSGDFHDLIDNYIFCLHPAQDAVGRESLVELLMQPRSNWSNGAGTLEGGVAQQSYLLCQGHQEDAIEPCSWLEKAAAVAGAVFAFISDDSTDEDRQAAAQNLAETAERCAPIDGFPLENGRTCDAQEHWLAMRYAYSCVEPTGRGDDGLMQPDACRPDNVQAWAVEDYADEQGLTACEIS